MTVKTKLPMGIEDFKRIRSEGFYYVDKTRFIKDFLGNKAYVNLFTRPRRFGKTLNMSMLKYFFEIGAIVPFWMVLRFQRKKNFVQNIWENFQ